MRVQRQSEGIRKGEPRDHKTAVYMVADFWERNCKGEQPNSYLGYDYCEGFGEEFIKKQQLTKSREHLYHYCDIAIGHLVKYTNGFEDYQVELIIEIDGERHDSINVKRQDKIFEGWIEEKYEGKVPVIRLRKDECLGTNEDRDTYLRDKLKDYLIEK